MIGITKSEALLVVEALRRDLEFHHLAIANDNLDIVDCPPEHFSVPITMAEEQVLAKRLGYECCGGSAPGEGRRP